MGIYTTNYFGSCFYNHYFLLSHFAPYKYNPWAYQPNFNFYVNYIAFLYLVTDVCKVHLSNAHFFYLQVI